MRDWETLAQREPFEAALDRLGWREIELEVMDAFVPRLLGFTVRSKCMRDGKALVLAFPCCRAVHTCFMRFPLDIAFIDGRGEVLELHKDVRPWRFLSCPDASSVMERAS